MFATCLKTLQRLGKTFDEVLHPRDDKGRWCGTYSATDSSGRKYSIVPEGNYIPPGGEGKRGARAGFEKWVDTPGQEPIAMPVLGLKIHSDHEIQFQNGRHRFAVLRDRGVKQMPVMTFRDGAEEFRRRFGV